MKNTLFVQATELFWKMEENKAEKEDGNDDESETTEKDQIEQTETKEKENVSTMSLLAIPGFYTLLSAWYSSCSILFCHNIPSLLLLLKSIWHKIFFEKHRILRAVTIAVHFIFFKIWCWGDWFIVRSVTVLCLLFYSSKWHCRLGAYLLRVVVQKRICISERKEMAAQTILTHLS